MSNKERIIDVLDPGKASHFIGFVDHKKKKKRISLFSSPLVISDRNEVTLYNISRHTRRRYECIASNGYPPDVARAFQLTIQFSPELTLIYVSPTNEEFSSSVLLIDQMSKEIRLKCRVVVNPFDQIYWMRDERKLVNNHRVHQYVSTYKENYLISELVLKDFNVDDQGFYTCFASNSLGQTSKSMQLLVSSTSSSTTSTTTEISTSTTTSFHSSRRKRPKHMRTTTLSPEQIFRSTELLREMSISSSSSHGKWW